MHTLADRYPPLHAYSADRVVRITLFLQGLGVDVGRVLLKRPSHIIIACFFLHFFVVFFSTLGGSVPGISRCADIKKSGE